MCYRNVSLRPKSHLKFINPMNFTQSLCNGDTTKSPPANFYNEWLETNSAKQTLTKRAAQSNPKKQRRRPVKQYDPAHIFNKLANEHHTTHTIIPSHN